MDKKIILEFERLDEVKKVLNDVGIDVNSVINIFLTKIINEQDISFLFNRQSNSTKTTVESNLQRTTVSNKMTKSKAIALFRIEGITFNDCNNIVFSSKNKTTDVYWSNPSFNHLELNWCFILNDYINNKLYLFKVPANSIEENMLVARADQTQLIDLQIMYGDPTFTDMRSKYSFSKFLHKTLSYSVI